VTCAGSAPTGTASTGAGRMRILLDDAETPDIYYHPRYLNIN
jgi:hypothetical protein